MHTPGSKQSRSLYPTRGVNLAHSCPCFLGGCSTVIINCGTDAVSPVCAPGSVTSGQRTWKDTGRQPMQGATFLKDARVLPSVWAAPAPLPQWICSQRRERFPKAYTSTFFCSYQSSLRGSPSLNNGSFSLSSPGSTAQTAANSSGSTSNTGKQTPKSTASSGAAHPTISRQSHLNISVIPKPPTANNQAREMQGNANILIKSNNKK